MTEAPSSIQPTAFVSHGSPMLALENGPWHAALNAWATRLSGVRAVVVASAHWESPGTFRVSSSPHPGVLHDFSGFPEALYRLDYGAPGDAVLASRVVELLRSAGLEALADAERPLDHGAWVPLRAMFPEARLPVIQVSLPHSRDPEMLVKAGQGTVAWFCGFVDRWIIAGLAVGGLSATTRGVGQVLRLFQTGNVQTYALWFAAGATILLYCLVR